LTIQPMQKPSPSINTPTIVRFFMSVEWSRPGVEIEKNAA
jgi:hypothetical protein